LCGVPRTDPALDESRGDDREHDGDEERRCDPEVEVRREVDVRVLVDQRGRIVGDLGQHPVQGRDEEVDPEARGDAGERRRDPGQRIAPDALERDRPERDQHEVAGIGGDARDHAEQDDDEGQRAARGHGDEPPDQRPDEPGRLGQPDADHHHQDDRHRREVAEVVDERGEQVAHAVDRQQALDLRRLGADLVVGGGLGLRGAHVRGLAGTAVVGLLRGGRRGLHDLVGRLDVEPLQRLGEQDDAQAQPQEEDRRVGHLVAKALDPVEHALHEGVLRRGGRGLRRVGHRAANRPKNSASATIAFSSSSTSTRSSGAWMFA
jgi:hypothetical protein